MSEFKVGDRVWIWETVIPARSEFPGSETKVWVEETTGKAVWAEPEDCLPDSPSLPAVARFLAKHPDFFQALETTLKCLERIDDPIGSEHETLALYQVFDFKAALATDAVDGGAG